MILDPFVSRFADKLITKAEEEKGEFQEPEIKNWLNKLREVGYDADDIFDEYMIENERLEQRSLSSKCVARFFHCFSVWGSRHSLGNRIKELNVRLEVIDGNKLGLNLQSFPSTPRAFEYHRSGSQMAEPEVVRTTSIDSHTRMLVKQLLKPRLGDEKNVLVYAISGMAGIGKTTLAWEIFRHEMIRAIFRQIRPVWVCVSKDYEKMSMMRKIIGAFKGDPGENQTLFELQNKLRELVTGKKFFLVLDDVWKIEVWDNLLKPCLWNGAPGSRILVTTRDRAISRRMDAEHEVQKLSPEDSWYLLCKMVFRGGDEREKQKLQNIGMRIVDKCDGLPLALTTIGGVLKGRDLIQAEWERVAGNSVWSFEQPEEVEGTSMQVMRALYMSYEELHSQLKQCFVFCALFPDNYVLRRDMLVPLWIAEGFIKASNDPPMEDTAEEYWKELVQRSLLQADPAYYDQGVCKMHNVVRSFALSMTQGECYSGDVQGFVYQLTATAISSSPKRRHVLIKDAKGVSIPNVIKEPTCLRTIIFLDTLLLPEYFFKNFPRLRVLDLSGAPNSKLPDAVLLLRHLRYLNLSRSQITEIPDTIQRLRKLQFLGLAGCTGLQILSGAIGELRDLRALDVDGTKLEGVPKGIGKLQRLSRLVGFRVNSNSNNVDSSEGQDGQLQSPATWCALEDLKSLTQLKFLMIQNLERISHIDEAESAELSSKSQLDELRLICNQAQEAIIDEEKRRIIKEVFDKLCPPSRLQRLKIAGYHGLEYPDWMMGGRISSDLPDLKHLELRDCFVCQTLPPLGLLPHLQILHISGAAAVESIGNKFLLGDAGQAQHGLHASFPKLKYLILENMKSWNKWSWDKGKDPALTLLPTLVELVIKKCDKLMALPSSLLHNVTHLTIECACSLGEVGNLPSVRTLTIASSELVKICDLPALENLTIVDCYFLRDVEKIDGLQYLKLEDHRMKSLPSWLLNEKDRQGFIGLRKFEFVCSIQLLQMCIKDGPEWPKIQGIPYVKGCTRDKSNYISYDKSNPESDFETNIEWRDMTINETKNSSSDFSPKLSIVILLWLIVWLAQFTTKASFFPSS